MLRSETREVHDMKCIVFSFVKVKVDILEKHEG
jgi:hypothetical protein